MLKFNLFLQQYNNNKEERKVFLRQIHVLEVMFHISHVIFVTFLFKRYPNPDGQSGVPETWY